MMIAKLFLRYGLPLIALLSIVGLIYGKGQLDARHANELQSIKQELLVAEEQLEKTREAYIADSIIAAADSKTLGKLQSKVTELDEYVDTLEDANRVCLDGRDVDSLRNLWKS